MLGEILERLTGNYRGDRPTLEQLTNGTAYQQPKPQPQAPILSLESLAQGTRNVATGIGDFLTGDDKRRDSERLAYEIGGLQREQDQRKEAQKLQRDLLMNRVKGNTAEARPFEIETVDEQGNPITKLVDAFGQERGRFPRQPKTPERKTEKRYSPDGATEWEVVVGADGKETEVKSTRRKVKDPARALTGGDIARINEASAAIAAIQEVDQALQNPNTLSLFGPLAGRVGTQNPYSEKYKGLDATLRKARQLIGKFMEGGVLRAEDEGKYKAMLPDPTDTPQVAQAKTQAVYQMLYMLSQGLIDKYRGAGYEVPESFNLQGPRKRTSVPDNEVEVVVP
jgi:hypothetical protein